MISKPIWKRIRKLQLWIMLRPSKLHFWIRMWLHLDHIMRHFLLIIYCNRVNFVHRLVTEKLIVQVSIVTYGRAFIFKHLSHKPLVLIQLPLLPQLLLQLLLMSFLCVFMMRNNLRFRMMNHLHLCTLRNFFLALQMLLLFLELRFLCLWFIKHEHLVVLVIFILVRSLCRLHT